MKKPASPDLTSRHSTAAWSAMCAIVATLMLTGCPGSKLPDAPPTVPQPKALLHLFHHSFEI